MGVGGCGADADTAPATAGDGDDIDTTPTAGEPEAATTAAWYRPRRGRGLHAIACVIRGDLGGRVAGRTDQKHEDDRRSFPVGSRRAENERKAAVRRARDDRPDFSIGQCQHSREYRDEAGNATRAQQSA